MKKTLLAFLVVILAVVILCYFWLNGTPWGNAHDKQAMVDLLNHKYGEAGYTLVREGYDVKHGGYGIVVSLKDQPSKEHVYVLKDSQLFETSH